MPLLKGCVTQQQFVVVVVAGCIGTCLLYTSDAADDLTRVDLVGVGTINKKSVHIDKHLFTVEQQLRIKHKQYDTAHRYKYKQTQRRAAGHH